MSSTNNTRHSIMSSVLLSILVLSGVAWSQSTPPRIFRNACPFECCRFGDWISRELLVAYELEDDTTKTAFNIMPNDTITAVSGNLHFDQIGTVVVQKPIYHYQKGDTLLVYNCGEGGFFTTWEKTKFGGVEMFWSRRPSEKEPVDKYEGKLIQESFMTWWVKVNNKFGQTGWLRLRNTTMYCFSINEKISGMDSCGN